MESTSANQLHKKSGSTLPFKEWIEAEKNKNVFIPNKLAQQEYLNADGEQQEQTNETKLNPESSKSTILNLDAVMVRNVAIVVVIVLGVVVVYKFSRKQASA